MREDWAKIDDIDAKKKVLKESLEEIKDSRAVYLEVMTDSDDKLEIWEELRDFCEDGNEVFAPDDNPKKRKRTSSPRNPGKKSKKTKKTPSNDDDSNADEEDEVESSDQEGNEEDSEKDHESDEEQPEREHLSMEQIETKIAQLKDDKKRARRERLELDAKSKSQRRRLRLCKQHKTGSKPR